MRKAGRNPCFSAYYFHSEMIRNETIKKKEDGIEKKKEYLIRAKEVKVRRQVNKHESEKR